MFSGEVEMHRKHTVNAFRDLPGLVYRMLLQVSSMRDRMKAEIRTMKEKVLSEMEAHRLMAAAIGRHVVPASQLPKVLNRWRYPVDGESTGRTAWSLYNVFTELAKSRSPRAQVERTLRLSRVFREGVGA